MKLLMAIMPLVITLVFITCTTGSAEKDANIAAAKQAIAASNAVYFKSFASNDSAIFIARYATDACIMAPGTPILCGKEFIATFFRSAYNVYGMRNGKFITSAVYGDGDDFVTEEGLWQSFDAAGRLFDDGKFLVLWKKTADGWKMYRDCFSSNRNK